MSPEDSNGGLSSHKGCFSGPIMLKVYNSPKVWESETGTFTKRINITLIGTKTPMSHDHVITDIIILRNTLGGIHLHLGLRQEQHYIMQLEMSTIIEMILRSL